MALSISWINLAFLVKKQMEKDEMLLQYNKNIFLSTKV